LIFFIVTQWVVSVQWNCFYKLEYLSLIVVQASLNGLKRCTKIYTSLVVRVAISAFGEYFCRIRNHVDKYVITKYYYQLMPLSLVTERICITMQYYV
ncbi:hypothetical protein T03_16938, partial [Trichinella britovi]